MLVFLQIDILLRLDHQHLELVPNANGLQHAEVARVQLDHNLISENVPCNKSCALISGKFIFFNNDSLVQWPSVNTKTII